MFQIIRNTVSVVLLSIYLTGFCGIHFIKHSCFSCSYSENYLALDAQCDGIHNCCSHSCCEHAPNEGFEYNAQENCSNTKLCCDYDLVYLKTNPTSTLIETPKIPLALETSLFCINSFTARIDTVSSQSLSQFANSYPDDYLQVKLSKLCTFRC